eukprot:8175784-Alexandrium_andersonii.AAC.1
MCIRDRPPGLVDRPRPPWPSARSRQRPLQQAAPARPEATVAEPPLGPASRRPATAPGPFRPGHRRRLHRRRGRAEVQPCWGEEELSLIHI